jgi:hypothetical protein
VAAGGGSGATSFKDFQLLTESWSEPVNCDQLTTRKTTELQYIIRRFVTRPRFAVASVVVLKWTGPPP